MTMQSDRHGRCVAGCVALVLVCNLGACTSTQAAREQELAELVARLPGDYDNLDQVKADEIAAVNPAHAGLHLRITALKVPIVSKYVFHVRETAADDSRRVVAQSIWTLNLSGDQMVHSSFAFAEPERWRSGDPAVFRALLPQDLRLLSGCELRWSRSGSDFNATGATGCQNALAEQGLQLHGEELAITRQSYAGSDPWYRFRRSR